MHGAGVIGLGIGLDNHCKAYESHPDVELKAVCDLLDEKLKTDKENFGIDAYNNIDEFLKRDDIL